METKAVLRRPRLSVIVPAMLGYETVLAALDSWEAQSCRDQLEILVLSPDADTVASLPPGQIVIRTGSLMLHQARALAIRQASADFVMLAEDHCLPDPSWAQAVLPRLEEEWDAVGPALRSGNPTSGWTQASFLIGYGQWMKPVVGGPMFALPGHNTVLRKSHLLELGSALEDELLAAAFLLRRLRLQGGRFCLEPEAGMRHFDIDNWAKTLRIFCYVGFGFGAVRTRRWPWVARALYWLGLPLVAARHWQRAWTHYRRAGREAGLIPRCLWFAALAALVWACGESVGAIMGVDRVAPLAWISEVKPVSRSQVETCGRSVAIH